MFSEYFLLWYDVSVLIKKPKTKLLKYDAEFHADFRNVQLYRVILYILRDIGNLLHNSADFAPASLISLKKAVDHEYLIK